MFAAALVREASAQPDARPLPGSEQPSPIRFNHLTPEDGLSQQSVQAILQDGFMWFGTENGSTAMTPSSIATTPPIPPV